MTDIRIPASQVTPDPVSALIAAYHADLLKLEAAYIAACQERRTRFEREVNALIHPQTWVLPKGASFLNGSGVSVSYTVEPISWQQPVIQEGDDGELYSTEQ